MILPLKWIHHQTDYLTDKLMILQITHMITQSISMNQILEVAAVISKFSYGMHVV